MYRNASIPKAKRTVQPIDAPMATGTAIFVDASFTTVEPKFPVEFGLVEKRAEVVDALTIGVGAGVKDGEVADDVFIALGCEVLLSLVSSTEE